LYDDDRTFDTMIIVLANSPKGKQMPDHENTSTSPTPTEEGHGKDQRGPSASQLAAAVEAAYILEAVRK
jgi:hypothetical protein